MRYISILLVILGLLICFNVLAMVWIGGNIKVDGKKCDSVRINYAWQISAEGCR